MCETYNGWSNRETWAFMLHMQNDAGLEAMMSDIIAGTVWERRRRGGDLLPAVADALKDLAETLFTDDGYRGEFGEDMPKALRRCAEDIGSLYRVNWRECAEVLAGTFDATVTA